MFAKSLMAATHRAVMGHVSRIMFGLALLATLPGCAIVTTGVASIGLRDQQITVANGGADTQVLLVREYKLEPSGGPCFTYLRYSSLDLAFTGVVAVGVVLAVPFNAISSLLSDKTHTTSKDGSS